MEIYGLSFESALKICTEFEYEVLDKKSKRFFRDGEVSLHLPTGTYRVTCVDEKTCIEELIQQGKEWIVKHRVVLPRDSFQSIVII